jgi:hypothetical protein
VKQNSFFLFSPYCPNDSSADHFVFPESGQIILFDPISIFKGSIRQHSFSLGDCLYFVIILVAAKWFWNKENPETKLEDNSAVTQFYLCFFIFLFHMLWALNYTENHFFEKMELKVYECDFCVY